MDPAILSFEALLSAARAGEEHAWLAVYRELAPKVLGYLRARSCPEPEDVLGEVFLQVVRDLERFTGDESDFRSWVFTIAHHRLLDDARYRSRRPVTLADGGELPHSPDLLGNAEDEALDLVASGEIKRALRTLGEDRQTVLLLRLFGGLRVPQIAALMGKSVGAVKALQRRGLADLKEALDDTGTLFQLEAASERG